jgi:hypothetical protein
VFVIMAVAMVGAMTITLGALPAELADTVTSPT